MDKKEIYEHLAKIYLDASNPKKKKAKNKNKFQYLFLASSALVVILSFSLFANFFKYRYLRSSETALFLSHEPIKINFNFNPAKKEIFNLNLNKLNLSSYKFIGFGVKKTNPGNTISLKLELTSIFKERSFVYLRDIPANWKEYKIRLSEFKGISDWSEMQSIAFIVEEWNAKEKKDVVYLDNIRVLR